MTAKNLQRVDEGGVYCHVYNKGIDERIIFQDDIDYQVFTGYLEDYLNPPKSQDKVKQEFTINGRVFKGVPHQPKNYFKKVELIAYNLKPDHFHLLLHQKTQNSLQAFIRSLCTRYSIYFNKKYNRTGSLFAGPYKSVIVNDEISLLLLTRYLNQAGGYSTYSEYSGAKVSSWVNTKVLLSAKFNKSKYKDFWEKNELGQKEEKLLNDVIVENQFCHLERRNLAEVHLKPWSRIAELLGSGTFFVLLLGIGLRNINNPPHNNILGNNIASVFDLGIKKITLVTSNTLGTKTSEPSAAPAATAEAETKTMITVKYQDPEVPINIRNEATTAAKIIGEAHDGDKFEFVKEEPEWFQIKLPNGLIGFISSLFVEKEGQITNSND